MSATPQSKTVLEALVASLHNAAVYNSGAMVAPAAVLWPDEGREWETLLPLLRQVLPELLTLGVHDQSKNTGPAIWLRCLLANHLGADQWTEGTTPIVYMPGVSRQMLRGVETCPKELQPLAELQYRGVFWSQQSSRDWTVVAFLKSKQGLGLDLAQNGGTQEALRRALLMVADTPVSQLSGHHLEASDFDKLLSSDPTRDLLRWLDNPGETKEQWTTSHWDAFRSICRESYGFDPQTDGELTAVEKMTEQQGPWKPVWSRFAEAPKSYQGIPKLLEQAHPASLLFDPSCWPKANDKAEGELRTKLSNLSNSAPLDAADSVVELESQHGPRRDWVWAELGRSPLATALEHLAVLADIANKALGGSTPAAMADAYTKRGWKADGAVLRALASVQRLEDLSAVKAAIQAIYRPWVEDAAHRLQKLVKECGFPGYEDDAPEVPNADPGECVFFADGLRYDVGRRLHDALIHRGLDVSESLRWVGLPSVTATSKPAVAPIASKVAGESFNDDFQPVVAETRKSLTIDRFRGLLVDDGYQILGAEETGDATGKAWLEHGELDHMGHEQGWKLAWRVAEQVCEMADRIEGLLDAGWSRIHLVTDHGWLLLPGGLPKTNLPKFLADTRWGRCAVLKTTASTDLSVVDWRWSSSVRIAVAPGISCFKAGIEYAHGGLSLQECLTPNFVIRRTSTTAQRTIEQIAWRGMRCRVSAGGSIAGVLVDIRTKPADAETSIASSAKPLDDEGTASLVVPNDDHMGTAAFVVLIDASGKVLTKKTTSVGGGGD